MNRRSFLQVGVGSMLWAMMARRGQAATHAAHAHKAARACILLYMEGGPSQLDTFDPKPGRETGGEFKAIPTTVAGIQISEHLPLIAKQMKRLAIIRSLTSKEGNHQRARHLMHTGYPPQGGVKHPALGSIVADANDPKSAKGLPGYVAIGGPGEDAGFLSPGLSPFPVQDPTTPVKYLSHVPGITDERYANRMALWRCFEDDFAHSHDSTYVAGQREVGEKAIALEASSDAGAFNVADEPEKTKTPYGTSEFGMGCLMARRLVEKGVPFVEVTQKGWDTHKDNFKRVKDLSADLDRGMSALLDDLAARGLLESTLVVWLGDFGRTPKINGNAGRDHYPQCSPVVLAGGGVKGGHVVGTTDVDGVEIKDRPVSVPDLFRSLAFGLGLDPDKVRVAPSGRPIKTVDGGAVVSELFG